MRTKSKITKLTDVAQALRVVEQRLSRMTQAHDEELVESVGIYGGPDLLRCRKCGIVLDVDARESADEEESIALYGRCNS